MPMKLTLEQELALLKFKQSIASASRGQLLELIELMFVADLGKTAAFNELIKHHWFGLDSSMTASKDWVGSI